jgi:hypothetical protein
MQTCKTGLGQASASIKIFISLSQEIFLSFSGFPSRRYDASHLTNEKGQNQFRSALSVNPQSFSSLPLSLFVKGEDQ